MWGFLKQRVYSNNPRSLENPKHDNKQAVDGTDNTLFENLQETVWKGWVLVFKMEVDIFNICYNYIFKLVYYIFDILEKIEINKTKGLQ